MKVPLKILLINPRIPDNFYNREFYLPSGILAVAAVLLQEGHEVRVVDHKVIQYKNPLVDESFFSQMLLKDIEQFNPGLIGFGGLFSGNFQSVLSLSKCVKSVYTDIPIVIGGAHPSMYPLQILQNCDSIDYLIIGEGENTILSLADQIKNQTFFFKDLDGFAYRENDQVIINPKLSFIEDLDLLPFPAYECINFEDYYEDTSCWHNPKNLEIKTEIPIFTSRSCPNACNFCASNSIMGRGWRPRSAENVVDEIQFLYENHGLNHFSFMDDNFTLSKPRLLDICRLINERNLDIQFETHNGVQISTLDEDVIDAMVNAGLTRIALPIESGSEYIRNKIMNKKLSQEKIIEVVEILKRYPQISIRAFFIIGMPEETHETLQDTYDLIQQINVEKVHLTNIVPFPGTKVYNQAVRDGLLVNLDEARLYLSDQLYQTNYNHFSIKPYKLDIEDLLLFRKKCERMIIELKHKSMDCIGG